MYDDYYNVVGVSYLRAILTPTRVNRLVTRLNGFPFDQRWLLRRLIFTRKFNWSPVVRVPIPINASPISFSIIATRRRP